MKIPLYCPTEEEVTDHTHINGRLCVCSKCGREQRPAAQVIARALAASNGPVKRGRPFAFTPEQIEAFRERRRNGESIKEIAESVGKKHWTLYPYLRGIKQPKPAAAPKGPPGKPGRKPDFTVEQFEALKQRREAGATIAELQAEAGSPGAKAWDLLRRIKPVNTVDEAEDAERERLDKLFKSGRRKAEENTRLVRLLSLVRALICGPVHLPTLAETIGTTDRTLERDMRALKAAGFKVSFAGKGAWQMDMRSMIARAIDEQEEQA